MKTKGAVYRVRSPDGDSDILVFDAGYEKGSLHVYRHEESIEAEELIEQTGKTSIDREKLGEILCSTEFGEERPQIWELEEGPQFSR